jgi:hypothetical protein
MECRHCSRSTGTGFSGDPMKLTLRSIMAALTFAVLSDACNFHVTMASERLDQSDKDSIREARQDLNDALATRNVERYRSYWLKDASVMWADGDMPRHVVEDGGPLEDSFRALCIYRLRRWRGVSLVAS